VGRRRGGGDLALLRVPLASFSDGREAAPAAAYRRLPPVADNALQNRFVGPFLLYGGGSGWQAPRATQSAGLYAVRHAGERVYELPLPHAVDRIEALGSNALVVGSDGRDLQFSSVRLGRLPVTVDRYTRRDAAQGETRSHGFFYKPVGETMASSACRSSAAARRPHGNCARHRRRCCSCATGPCR
jgi:hypothetical protein